MRKKLARIHTWLGLLCAPILVIFGLTSLQFNHQWNILKLGERVVSWERDISVQDTEDNNELCNRIYEAVGMKGDIYGWEARRHDDGSFTFRSKHPGKNYFVRVNAERTHATVDETRFGPLLVLVELHGAHTYRSAGLSWVWMAYTNIAILFVVYAGASGVYFWTKRKNKYRLDWILLVAITGGSLLLLATVRLWG